MKVLFAQLASKTPKKAQNFPIGPLIQKPDPQDQSRRSKNNFKNREFKSFSLSVSKKGRQESSDTSKSQMESSQVPELTIESVMDIRNEERIFMLKRAIEAYREFLDPFEFQSKLEFMILRNGNRNKIRSLKNFQYSLGKPKKIIFQKTPISVNGIRGDIINEKDPKNRFNYIFKSFNNRCKMILPKLTKATYVCQSQETGSKTNRRTSELALFMATGVKTASAKLVSFKTKKLLISNKSMFESRFCEVLTRVFYQNQNFNEPILNSFSEKGISILNLHKCLKGGKERIINSLDLFQRKLTVSKEISIKMDSKEILGNYKNLNYKGKYIFFRKKMENVIDIFLYDFGSDNRKKIGSFKTENDVTNARSTKVETKVFKVKSLTKKLKTKMKLLLDTYKGNIIIPNGEEQETKFTQEIGNLDEEVFGFLDVRVEHQYKIKENFLFIIFKGDLTRLACLKVDPLVLLNYDFMDIAKSSGG